MRTLSVDIETFSNLELKKTGVYSYAGSPDFEILLFGYAWDDDSVEVVDLVNGDKIPNEVVDAIICGTAKISAFNAQFERVCLSRYFKVPGYLSPDSFTCTMVHSLYLGLPSSLDQTAKVLKVGEKIAEGKVLINYFCSPCKPTKVNVGRTRNLPQHDPEKWELFKEYNRRDVEVEREVRKKLSRFSVPESERRLWVLDQQINDRGILVDVDLVQHAIACDEQHKARTMEEAIALTGLDNPGSVQQLKAWLMDVDGLEVAFLNKASVPELLKQTESDTVKRVLELRQELAKTSVRKYAAMKNALCDDGRVRGLLQFYGARTGRWAGRIFQPQNLPRIVFSQSDLSMSRQLLKLGQYETLDMLYRSVPEVLSQLVRTILVAAENHIFHVVDFSSIEALLLAYYAGEQWALEVFNAGGDIYIHTASRMYDLPVAAITKDSAERARGKVGCLACGYQGSIGAIQKFVKPGEMTEEEMRDIVSGWREANPHIVAFWKRMEDAAREAIQFRTRVPVDKGIGFECKDGMLFMQLPSGRKLSYPSAKLEPHPTFNSDAISFQGMNNVTKKWERQFTYSGKLVENAIQAIARDCLAHAMYQAEAAGYPILLTVHDELITQTAADFGSVKELASIVTCPIPWAPGLKLRASGDSTHYYCK